MNRIVVQSYEEILSWVSTKSISEILSPSDIQRAARFHHDEDRDRFVAARILLWHELRGADAVSGANQQLALHLSHNAYGKPELSDNRIHFNWSHSGNLIALILDEEICGIDIEINHGRRLFDMESLCTPIELDWLEDHTQGSSLNKGQAFLILWSAKEAALKAQGRGLSVDPRHVEVCFQHGGSKVWTAAVDGAKLPGRSQVLTYESETYALSWCSALRSDSILYGKGISN